MAAQILWCGGDTFRKLQKNYYIITCYFLIEALSPRHRIHQAIRAVFRRHTRIYQTDRAPCAPHLRITQRFGPHGRGAGCRLCKLPTWGCGRDACARKARSNMPPAVCHPLASPLFRHCCFGSAAQVRQVRGVIADALKARDATYAIHIVQYLASGSPSPPCTKLASTDTTRQHDFPDFLQHNSLNIVSGGEGWCKN